MERERGDKKSLAMVLLSMLIFGTIGLLRRSIPLSSALLACVRGALGALFLLLLTLLRRRPVRIGRKTALLLALSGALIGFNWVLLFEAYNYTDVPTATLCYYMQPTIVILLSPLLLRERLTGRKIACAAAALVGAALISGVPDMLLHPETAKPSGDVRGILLALGAAALYAGVVILNKKTPGVDPFGKTAVQMSAAALAILPYVLLTEDFSAVKLDAAACALTLVAGLIHTGVAYALFFTGMDGLKGQTVALLSYIDPVSALIFAAAFLGETLSPLGVAGAILILGAAFLSETNLPRKRGIFKSGRE